MANPLINSGDAVLVVYDRKAFWTSRMKSYNEYVAHPEHFNFIEVEIYRALSASKEMKNWVECSAEFLK